MRSKKGRISAVFLALVLLFSFTLVMFAGCGDEGDGDSNTAKLVTDDSLSDKLLAMYTFEESNPSAGDALNAYDPFTGTAIASANGQYEVNEYVPSITTVAVNSLTQDDYTLTTDSTRAFDVRTPLYLSGTMNELYERTTDSDGNSLPNFEKGVSASFWVYNWDQDKTVSSETEGTLAIDYANIVTNGRLTVTWGNLNDNGTVKYPDQDTTVGRAAYTDKYITGSETEGSYYDAQAEFTSEQLSKFDTGWASSGGYDTYDFTGWNVISGNVQDADEGSTVDQISDYCYQTWRYVTVSMDEDGISFYMNGRLAYYYPAATYLASAPGWTDEQTLSSTATSYYYRFIYALVGGQVWDPVWEENTDVSSFGFVFNMFGADAKAYVDDLIIGYALEDSEVQALYEDLSGVTYAAEDVTIGTSLSAEEIGRQNAINTYLEGRLNSYKGEVAKNTADNGTGSYTATQRDALLATSSSGDLKDIVDDAYETIGATSLSAGTTGGTNYYVPTATSIGEDGSFEMSVTVLQLSNMSGGDANYYEGIYPMVFERNGTSWNKVAGFQSGGAAWDYGTGSSLGNGQAVQAWNSGIVRGNAMASDGLVWTTTNDHTDLDFTEVSKYCWITITLEYDGEDLTISWSYYYYYMNEEVTLTNTETQEEFQYQIAINASYTRFGTLSYTLESVTDGQAISDVLTVRNLGLAFGSEHSYVVVTDLENCEVYSAA